jgi:hypothetical protein
MVGKFLIIFFFVQMFAAFFIIPIKANSHLKYLKSVKKKEFERYNNFFQIMYRDIYYSVVLMLPLVIKIKNHTHDSDAKFRLKRARVYGFVYTFIYVFITVYFVLLIKHPEWYKQ